MMPFRPPAPGDKCRMCGNGTLEAVVGPFELKCDGCGRMVVFQ